jgi:hypothetical protein
MPLQITSEALSSEIGKRISMPMRKLDLATDGWNNGMVAAMEALKMLCPEKDTLYV